MAVPTAELAAQGQAQQQAQPQQQAQAAPVECMINGVAALTRSAADCDAANGSVTTGSIPQQN
jgi:hypothetical protein